ncbi:MAG: MBL fold metallo-hydrolase [Chloroflexi bacterium]|nr:MBL fold metallo-hydrolase [Chloroflexota bacterium]
MPEWIVLGSAHAVPDATHANTHFVLVGKQHTLLVDAPCEVIGRLRRVGLTPNDVTDLLLTHFHPDHTAGVPMLLMSAWLQGRQTPLHIYGLEDTLTGVQQVMSLYRWENWPDFFPVHFHTIEPTRLTPVLANAEWEVKASPVVHMVPAVGIRITFPNQEVLAYSGDTGPTESVVELAREADYLFHEASGEMDGHTSAAQAGEIATQARAKRLYLVHTDADPAHRARLAVEAQKTFDGPVVVANDLLRLTIGA